MKPIIKLFLPVISALLLLAPSRMVAQVNRQEDVVYLKNGGVIHGTILEMKPTQSLRIKTHDGNIFAYKMTEVDKTVKEDVQLVTVVNTVEENPVKDETPAKEKIKSPPVFQEANNNESIEMNQSVIEEKEPVKNFFSVETGYLAAMGDLTTDNSNTEDPNNYFPNNTTTTPATLPNNESGYFIRSKYSFPVSKSFYIGGGVEMDFYQSKTLVPFSIDLRLNFSDAKTQPFFNLALGHAVSTGTESGGFMLDINGGAKIMNAQGHAFAIGLSYRVQNSDYKYTNGTDELTVPVTAHFLALNIGYVL